MTNHDTDLTEVTNLEGVTSGAPLLEVAGLVETMIAELRVRVAERQESEGDQRGAKRLERAARSVETEYRQLRQHLDRYEDEQAIQSTKRLLIKVIRLQRRIEAN